MGASKVTRKRRQGALTRRMTPTHLLDLGRGEFGVAILLPATSDHPPLGDFVLYVVEVCPDEQMLRVDAPTIVATMKNVHPVGDTSICSDVGKPMSRVPAAIQLPLTVTSGGDGPHKLDAGRHNGVMIRRVTGLPVVVRDNSGADLIAWIRGEVTHLRDPQPGRRGGTAPPRSATMIRRRWRGFAVPGPETAGRAGSSRRPPWPTGDRARLSRR